MNKKTMLLYLAGVSNKYLTMNVLCHGVVYAAIILYFWFQSRGQKVIAGVIRLISIIFLLSSVTIIAIKNGNPFHVITFAVTTILLLVLGVKGLRKREGSYFPTGGRLSLFLKITSAILLFIGIFYPEFTEVSLPQFLIYAPVGIVPCPTLLTTLGLINLTADHNDRSILVVLAVMSGIYGIVGVFVFHVYLDIALLILAAMTVVNIFTLNNKKPFATDTLLFPAKSQG